jgi:hypothetical protein
MARFVEPVFCSTVFPFFLTSDTLVPENGLQPVRDDDEDAAQSMDCHDHSDVSTQEYSHGCAIEDAAFRAPTGPDALLQQPQDSAFQDGDEPQRRLPVNNPDIILPLDMRSDPLAMSRTISHQHSCDSLRNFGTSADSRYSQASISEPRTVAGAENESLPEEVRLQGSSAAQYTILTDMVESAWSVDDPRYGADVLDSLDSWTAQSLSAAQAKLSHALFERTIAEPSTLPTFNRQEYIKSGHDMQGIAWDDYKVDRQQCLRHRAVLYDGSSSERMLVDDESALVAQSERFYRFKYFNGSKRPKYAHHQLRHVLASVGRDVYYTNASKVMQASLALPSAEDTVLDLTRSTITATPIRVTTLAATDSAAIVAGGFDGEYAIRSLESPTSSHSEGFVTHDRNGLVTHIHTFAHRRSGLPQAAFCANDQRLRLMDLTTEKFTKTLTFDYSLNSAVTSADGRLRALVGDSPDALVTDAESGETLATLQNHNAHIFSCAWSPDDRLLATGAQDGKIALWDSRNWTRPLAELPNALSCSRSLHFTSDSSKLISAENEDVVSIFDMRGLAETRQDIRFFGTICGVTLVDGGDEIVVANGDRSVGGLMSFRRLQYGGGGGGYLEVEGGSMDPVERCWRRSARRRYDRRVGIVEELVV